MTVQSVILALESLNETVQLAGRLTLESLNETVQLAGRLTLESLNETVQSVILAL